jgi:hypothetical protein
VTEPVGKPYAVTCQACLVKVWEGDVPPADGQVLLTNYAESTPGNACPSKVAGCPNKTAAVVDTKQWQPAKILARLAALEAKVKP